METTVIDLLNISYTQESSVMTEGEMSFIWPILGLCTSTVISRCARFDIVALCLVCQTLEPEDHGRFQGGHL